MSDSNSSSEKDNFKSLLIKGVIGAATLAGTTAIPILVQQSLQPPSASPTASPARTLPAQISPASSTVSPIQSFPSPNLSELEPTEATQSSINPDEDKSGKKGKKKGKKEDDDEDDD